MITNTPSYMQIQTTNSTHTMSHKLKALQNLFPKLTRNYRVCFKQLSTLPVCQKYQIRACWCAQFSKSTLRIHQNEIINMITSSQNGYQRHQFHHINSHSFAMRSPPWSTDAEIVPNRNSTGRFLSNGRNSTNLRISHHRDSTYFGNPSSCAFS